MVAHKKFWVAAVLSTLILAIAFLPNIGSLTYFKDDWYYIYDALKAGAGVFHPMFSIDRPARGFFFEIYYLLLGPYPLPYHIGAFLWRAVAMVGAFWLFNLLWPRERRFAFFAALLFGLYPGYFWWVSAIEYQPMIASLALQVLSIALTLKAVQASKGFSKVAYLAGAILTGWLYIALVDYAIGMEVFRFASVYVLVSRDTRFSASLQKWMAAIKAWAWNLLIPFGFIFWRLFFFNNERKATDIGLQLSGLFASPISTLANWGIQLVNSAVNLGILAWVRQFSRFFFELRLRDMMLGLLAAGIVTVLVVLTDRLLYKDEPAFSDKGISTVTREALLIALPGMLFGILPVIMANRTINLEEFSHYGLPASLAAALGLMGILQSIASSRIRSVGLYLIIVFAVLSHFSISIHAKTEETAISEFWWQVSWRAPALRSESTLVINYPLPNIGDDGNGVLEAANMLYFPQPTGEEPVHYNLSAVTLTNMNVKDVLLGKLSRQVQYRSHAYDVDFGNVLVLSQPALESCVHVMDGRHPFYSASDPGNVILVGSASNIDNVRTGAAPSVPQEFAFGPEPLHTWCFYYEKAGLALQTGQWDQVVSLGDEAIRLGLHPVDQSEWMPFLQAYAMTGNTTGVKQVATKIGTDKYLQLQACNELSSVSDVYTPEVAELVSTLYCKGAR